MPIAPYDPKNDPVQLYRHRGSGPIYRAIGLITDPAVILEDIATGEQRTVVISSLNAKDYIRLVDEPEQEAKP